MMCTDDTTERWLPVKGFSRYEVSDYGRVKSLAHSNQNGRFWRERILVLVECTPKGRSSGYLSASLTRDDGLQRPQRVHRLVAVAFVKGRDEVNNEVNHLDGAKTNNHYTNLEWTTRKGNVHHASVNELISNKKLTTAKVLEIKGLIGEVSYSKLSKIYGVGTSHIARIAHGQTWKHLA